MNPTLEGILYTVLAVLAFILALKFAGKILKIILGIVILAVIAYLLVFSGYFPKITVFVFGLF